MHVKTFAISLLTAAALAANAAAHDFKLGEMTIDHPWSRATAPTAKNGAAYLTVHNEGATPDRIVGVAGDVAARVELHTHLMENNVMRMVQVDHVPVPAHGMAELKPGGYHIMLMGLHRPLNKGESFPITVTFEKAGPITLEFQVESAGSMGSGTDHGKMGHGQEGHGKMGSGHKMKH